MQRSAKCLQILLISISVLKYSAIRIQDEQIEVYYDSLVSQMDEKKSIKNFNVMS